MGKMSAAEWEKKWKLMVDRENNKKTQNRILCEKLREKKELEEAIECTFWPKIQRKSRTDPSPKRSREELLQLLLPVITEEEGILRELKKVEEEERQNMLELSEIVASHISRQPRRDLSYFLTFYRDERMKDISNSKNLKVEIVGKLHELERKFNAICSSECLEASDLRKVGFEIDKTRGIKEEVAKSIESHDSLKNRSKVSGEFEEILQSFEVPKRPPSQEMRSESKRCESRKGEAIRREGSRIDASRMEAIRRGESKREERGRSFGNFQGNRSFYGPVYVRDPGAVPVAVPVERMRDPSTLPRRAFSQLENRRRGQLVCIEPRVRR